LPKVPKLPEVPKLAGNNQVEGPLILAIIEILAFLAILERVCLVYQS
jgi:hypothetical protein